MTHDLVWNDQVNNDTVDVYFYVKNDTWGVATTTLLKIARL